MLAWVVINRQQPRQFTTKSSSPCTLCLCVKLSGSFPPTPVVSTAYGHPSTTAAPQLLCNQSVTHAFCLDGGCTPSGSPRPIPYSLCPISFPITLLSTLLHSAKSQLHCFQSIPHSLPKTPGGGVPTFLVQCGQEASHPR
jgi:hypothetical protein